MAKALYHLFIFVLAIGIIGIPGCIEFNTGWIQSIVLILIGGAGALIIPRAFHYEGDHEKY